MPRILQLKKIPSKSTLNSWFSMFDIELIKQKMRDFFRSKSQILAVDVESKLILDFEFLYKQRHDLFVFEILLQRLKFNFKYMLGDKGYYSFKIFKFLKEKGILYIVPLKNYGDKCRSDNIIRKQFHNCYYEN